MTYLGKANEEELVVGEAEGWQDFLIPVLFQPVLICLETRRSPAGSGDTTYPTTLCHSLHLPSSMVLPGRQP